MTSPFARSRCFTAIAFAALLPLAQNARAQSPTYVGEAVVAKASVLGLVNVAIEDTGALPSTGGSLSTELLHASVPSLLNLDLLSASTNGANSQTNSAASVADVTVSALGIYISASVLNSNAAASCTTATGSSTILGLTVNGLSIDVTGAPNQTIPLIVGSLIINEQISSITTSPTLNAGDMLVNALHLSVDGIADVVVSSSHAGVKCPVSKGCGALVKAPRDLGKGKPADVPCF